MSYDIQRNLVNHPPTEETQWAMEDLRATIHSLAAAMKHGLPDGREKALAFTKLEEATMWAMASLARNDYDNRPVEDEVVELSGHAMGHSGVRT